MKAVISRNVIAADLLAFADSQGKRIVSRAYTVKHGVKDGVKCVVKAARPAIRGIESLPNHLPTFEERRREYEQSAADAYYSSASCA